jgi:hypothetical protein
MKLKISLSTDVCLMKKLKGVFLMASKEWPFVIVSGKIRASLLGRFLYTKTPKLVSFFIIPEKGRTKRMEDPYCLRARQTH